MLAKTSKTKKEFRKDINGLRAIAVIAVVIFHFSPNWLSGGFTGVDVFFVISGFLMTGIIFRGLENNTFSVLHFYIARANRIIPALAVLCVALLIFGWLYLTPQDYRSLGKHIASSIGFFSNIVYGSESGYFDGASHEKWLLHTWSLSVEWQFYLLYPLILVAMKRFMSLIALQYTIIIGALISFIFCIYFTDQWATGSFYLLPSRIWEMLVGGIAFLYPMNHINNNNKVRLELIGIAAIIGSYLFISPTDTWPGYLSIFPVLGTFLIIQAHRRNSLLTNNYFFNKIGLWSYSIYLWHWAVVVMMIYFDYQSSMLLGIMASILLGYLSYHFIEKNPLFAMRKPQTTQRNSYSLGYFKAISIALVVGIISSYIYLSGGAAYRVDQRVLIASQEASNRPLHHCMVNSAAKPDAAPCVIGNKDNIQAIIIGDSHADALTSSVASAMDSDQTGLLVFTRVSCPFILGVKDAHNKASQCGASNAYTAKLIQQKYSQIPIFFINRTSVYIYGQSNPSRVKNNDYSPLIYFSRAYTTASKQFLTEFSEHYIDTVCQLSQSNPVFITTPIPEMRVNVPKTMAKRMLLEQDFSEISLPLSRYTARNTFVLTLLNKTKQQCNINILDVKDSLCDNAKCHGSKQGRPLYYDGDHMSEYGNKILTPLFKSVLIRFNK